MGQSGQWALDIDEGTLGDDFTGRKWDVSLMTASQCHEAQSQADSERRTYAQVEKDKADEAKFLIELDRLDSDRRGVSKAKLKAVVGFGTDKMIRIETRLIDEGIIETVPGFQVETPNGGKKSAVGFRRAVRAERAERTSGH